MKQPTITILVYANGGYVKRCQFDMERMRNAGGLTEQKYVLQGIALNHLKTPVLVQAVHLTPDGIEVYVTEERPQV